MSLPNFLIIGAAKAGTTSLYHYLRQHPDVYLPEQKETNFFALEGAPLDFRGPGDREFISSFSVTRFEDYLSLFSGVTTESAVGEVSPMYLYSSQAPIRIRDYVPDAKLICILRNPVERAFSHFLMFVRDHREPYRRDFARAISAERGRMEHGWEWAWNYVDIGFYGKQLARYYSLFEREQIRVYLYEDLEKDPVSTVQDMFHYLGVDSGFRPDTSVRHNLSVVRRSEWLNEFLEHPTPVQQTMRKLIPIPAIWRHRLATRLRKKNIYRPSLGHRMRRRLLRIYHDDILMLQDLIGRDLGSWLKD